MENGNGKSDILWAAFGGALIGVFVVSAFLFGISILENEKINSLNQSVFWTGLGSLGTILTAFIAWQIGRQQLQPLVKQLSLIEKNAAISAINKEFASIKNVESKFNDWIDNEVVNYCLREGYFFDEYENRGFLLRVGKDEVSKIWSEIEVLVLLFSAINNQITDYFLINSENFYVNDCACDVEDVHAIEVINEKFRCASNVLKFPQDWTDGDDMFAALHDAKQAVELANSLIGTLTTKITNQKIKLYDERKEYFI